jgi:uncharacterized membrane protein YphA (DoxX/SURF4 family)
MPTENTGHRLLRIALGLIFLCASWQKIADPQDFAQIVANYRLLPALWVNWVALVLPWIEAVCGLMLICGKLVAGAALTVATLMAVFMAAFTISLYRGLDISCGCFSLTEKGRQALHFYLIRDALILGMGLWVLYARIKVERRAPA